MFLHLLPKKQQELFLKIARLIGTGDAPLLWDGKTREEVTNDTDIKKISFQVSEQEEAVFKGLERECGLDGNGYVSVDKALIGKLPRWEVFKNTSEERIRASVETLHELLGGGIDSDFPSLSKIMLYELMLLALADGQINIVEGALLKQFSAACKLEDFIHDDLLERAQSMNRETVKTIAIIFE